ncbi:MAG: AAA family ATPase [Thiobacillus sp.]
MSQNCPNPIIGLDEIDKPGGSRHNGNPWDTLLSMLERQTAQKIFDEFLLGEIDYSHINWIATANSVGHIPSVLLSRLRVVQVLPPRKDDFDAILQSIRNDIAKMNGVHPAMLPHLHDQVLNALRRQFVQSGNVRALSKMVMRLIAQDVELRPQYLH